MLPGLNLRQPGFIQIDEVNEKAWIGAQRMHWRLAIGDLRAFDMSRTADAGVPPSRDGGSDSGAAAAADLAAAQVQGDPRITPASGSSL